MMDTFEPAQLDNNCPHQIESKELLKWTSLDKLEQDFASFRGEIDLLDTRIKIGSKFFKKLEEDKSRELINIFIIPAKAGKTLTDIIDIRLCAHIRALEFILREIRDKQSKNIWIRLLGSLNKSPNIIGSFEHADDGPDVRWFFKNRVMIFLLRESLIHYRSHYDYLNSVQRHPDYPRLKFLESPRPYIDEDDCYVILEEIIFPQLEPHSRQHYNCIDCHVDFDGSSWLRKISCPYLAMMKSLVDRHDSMLQRSIRSSMDQLLKASQAKRLLIILFRIAHDRKEWELINESLACLLSSPTIEMKAFAIRVFGRLVRWNRSRDGPDPEMLLEHSNIMIKFLEFPSREIQDANHMTWKCLGVLGRLKPREFKLLRVVVGIYLKKIGRIKKNQLTWPDAENTYGAYKTLHWLIMPKANDNTGEFGFTSSSNQLVEDLKLIALSLRRPDTSHFRSVSEEYRDSLMDDESKIQFDLILDRVSWLFVKELSVDRSISLKNSKRLFEQTSYSILAEPRKLWPECLSLARYLNFCEILLEIHQYFYNPSHILEPQRCSWFLQVILGLGSWRYNEERLRAIESCLLRAIEIHPRQRSKFFEALETPINVCQHPLRSAQRLAHHDNRTKGVKSIFRESYLFSNDIRGIHARRMLLVSLCKYLIADLNLGARDQIPVIVNLLGELELAYELRAEQGYSELNVDFSLLITCAELAFPTPFDDPNNPMYICEFAYFRDTMDYLRRNKPEQLDRICSQFSEDTNKRLEYYQNDYDKFDVCCYTRSLDKERDRFRCIDHKISAQAEPQICPLHNRYQYCHYIKN